MIAAGLIANAGTLLAGVLRRGVRAWTKAQVSLASSRRRRATVGGGGADRVEVGGVFLVAADVAAEVAVDQLEGELVAGPSRSARR